MAFAFDLDQHHHRDAEEVADRFVGSLPFKKEPLLVHPMAVVGALDGRVRAWGRKACKATVSFDPELSLRAPLASTAAIIAWMLAHEVGHLAADFDGVPRPHDEEWIDHVAAAVWLRREAVRRALARWGWEAPELLTAFGELPARYVFQRVAVVGGGVVMLYRGRSRREVYAPEHVTVQLPTKLQDWERRWRRVAESGGVQRGFWGEGAWRIEDPAEGGATAILLPPESLGQEGER